MSPKKKKFEKSDISFKLEKILKPLGNITRQELLLLIAARPITYTEIFEHTKLESGLIYWHLKKMELLIEQTVDKRYYLSDLGRKAYELLTYDGEFSYQDDPKWVQSIENLVNLISQNPTWVILQQITILLVILSYGFSSQKLIQIGSLPLYYEETSFLLTLLSLIASLLVQNLFLSSSIYISEKINKRRINPHIFLKFLFLSVLFNFIIFLPGIIVSLVILITNDLTISLHIFILFPLTLISTLISVLASMGLIYILFEKDYKNSLLLALISYYPYLILSLMIQLLL